MVCFDDETKDLYRRFYNGYTGNIENHRREELKDFILECCNSSSILYAGKYPSVKLIDKTGVILYVDDSRHL